MGLRWTLERNPDTGERWSALDGDVDVGEVHFVRRHDREGWGARYWGHDQAGRYRGPSLGRDRTEVGDGPFPTAELAKAAVEERHLGPEACEQAVGLRWESAPFGLALGYRPEGGGNDDGTHVGLVRRDLRGAGAWIAFYDRDGLLGEPKGLRLGADWGHGRLRGSWETATQAERAVDRHHDAVTSVESPPG